METLVWFCCSLSDASGSRGGKISFETFGRGGGLSHPPNILFTRIKDPSMNTNNSDAWFCGFLAAFLCKKRVLRCITVKRKITKCQNLQTYRNISVENFYKAYFCRSKILLIFSVCFLTDFDWLVVALKMEKTMFKCLCTSIDFQNKSHW